MLIYKIKSMSDFELFHNHKLPPKYKSYSKNIDFCYKKIGDIKPGQGIIFFSQNQIEVFDFNKDRDQFQIVYVFVTPLISQPDYTMFDANQNYAIIASNDEALLVNMNPDIPEIDLDEQLKISEIKTVVVHENKIFLLTNKYRDILGYYVVELDTS